MKIKSATQLLDTLTLVNQLQKMGYVGPIPETASELRELVKLLSSIP
jgi:hypothetical protein